MDFDAKYQLSYPLIQTGNDIDIASCLLVSEWLSE